MQTQIASLVEHSQVVEVVRVVTRTELIKMLSSLRGATFITFRHKADMSDTSKMRKVGNPYWGNCFKTQTVNGMVNFQYDEGVLRRLEKEGKSPDSFRQGTSWHNPVTVRDHLTPFCHHKTDPRKIYIRFMYLKQLECSFHTDEGVEIDPGAIKAFLKERSSYANQGLDKPLVFTTWDINSVLSCKFNGKSYVIQGE
jgi:hypothetical protein